MTDMYSPDTNKDKIYINLNVQHTGENIKSTAKADYNLLNPVLEKGGNFQLTVTDLQIDTRLIPIFIAELYPQQKFPVLSPYRYSLYRGRDGYFILNYWVRISDHERKNDKIYLKRKITGHTSISAISGNESLGYFFSNNNSNLYIYSYQEFIDMVNEAIETTLNAVYEKGSCGFLIRDGKLVFIIQDNALFRKLTDDNTDLRLEFSPSLYQYLAPGFPVQIYPEYWSYILNRRSEAEDYYYYSLVQNNECLQTWNSCKAIAIYSLNMPIADETYPVIESNTSLTHYTIPGESISRLYTTANTKKKIIYIHYINYNEIKTLSNGISVHNNSIENGIKIDLDKSLPMNKFNITIGWVDSYGNLFPLEIPYGGCCNIRLCFSRRNIKEYYDYTQKENVNNYIYPGYDYYTPSIDYYNQDIFNDLYTEPGISTPQLTEKSEMYNTEENGDDELIIEPEKNISNLNIGKTLFTPIIEEEKSILDANSDIPPPPLARSSITEIKPEETNKDDFYKKQTEIMNNFKKYNNLN